ncbi:MAG: alpha/beta hydrolase-fold protein [Gemmatales bacterium]
MKPLVQSKHNIDQNQQTLFGHSLGGLFTLHVLFQHPTAFQTYVASSPSIWWNDKSIQKEEDLFVKSLYGLALKARLHINVGGLEQQPQPGEPPARAQMLKANRMVDNAREMAARLEAANHAGLTASFTLNEGENHGSVIPLAINQTLRFALEKKTK